MVFFHCQSHDQAETLLLAPAALRLRALALWLQGQPGAAAERLATSADAGIVRIHAQTMRSTTVSFRLLNPFAQPTPMMEAVIACVVETGMPNQAAKTIG